MKITDLAKNYLTRAFGFTTDFVKLEERELRRLPLFLRGSYDLFISEIFGRKFMMAVVRDETSFTPARLKTQASMLKKSTGMEPVFVFSELESYQRHRLMEQRIPYIVPGKQAFIPTLLLDVQERGKDITVEIREKLRPASQCLLLYHLEVSSLADNSFQEIADRLGYSPMTVTRIARELEGHGLCEIQRHSGATIVFRFAQKQLWEKALPILESPVLNTYYSNLPLTGPYFRTAGETALAFYSDLAESRIPVYAIGKEDYHNLKNENKLPSLNQWDGETILQVWSYNPTLLSRKKQADPLSLFLSFREEEDDRIQIALKQLQNHFPW